MVVLVVCAGMFGCRQHTPATAPVLRGIWWSADQPQSAAFEFKDSTVYYPDMFVEFKYAVRRDTLVVHRDEGESRSVIVRLTADSLILSTANRLAAYSRSEPRRP
jgi:hypothetical protein